MERMKDNKARNCPVQGCRKVTKSMRVHCMEDHLSPMFDNTFPGEWMEDDRFHKFRYNMVATIGKWVTRKEDATPQMVLEWLKRKIRWDRTIVAPEAEVSFHALCRRFPDDFPDPRRFSLCPPNSPVLIIYWRVMVEVLPFLRRDEIELIRTERYHQRVAGTSNGANPAPRAPIVNAGPEAAVQAQALPELEVLNQPPQSLGDTTRPPRGQTTEEVEAMVKFYGKEALFAVASMEALIESVREVFGITRGIYLIDAGTGVIVHRSVPPEMLEEGP